MSFRIKETNNLPEDDYYSFLSVSRNATDDEIVNAYRKLCLIYHPDKHQDEKKKAAEIIFNKVHKAYTVLKDPHKRAIYDTLGIKGLESNLFQIVKRTKTPSEIREDYERYLKEKEEILMRQRTMPRGSLIVGLNATELFEPSNRNKRKNIDFYDLLNFPRIEISSMSLSQTVDAPLNLNHKLSLSGILNSQNGNGSGNFICSLKKVLSEDSWGEFQFAAGQGPIFTLRGCKVISKKNVLTASGLLHFLPNRIGLGTELSLGRNLSKHLGYFVTWKSGINSALNSSFVYEKDKYRVNFQVQISLANTNLMVSYTRKFEINNTSLKTSIKTGFLGSSIEYGCETKLTKYSNIGASVTIGDSTGVTLKLKLSRGNQNYVFNILLSDELIIAPVFYATVCPLIAYYCVKKLIIEPYEHLVKQQEQSQDANEHKKRMYEKRKEAELSTSLMEDAYKRSIETEKNKEYGIVIEYAVYGNARLLTEYVNKNIRNKENNFQNGGTSINQPSEKQLIVVTIPLQCLIKDSILNLPEASKINLPGFYDPCPGEEKKLYIRFKFRGLIKEIYIQDNEKVRLPTFT